MFPGKCAKNLNLLSQTIQNMEHKKFHQQLLNEVKLDAAAIFMANGDIRITPCPWEDDKEVTPSGERVKYRAGIEVDADGRTRVKRWNVGKNGPKHLTVFETPHGCVKVPHKWKRNRPAERKLTIQYRFPEKYGMALIRQMLMEEHDQVMSFLKSRKEETVWN